MIVVYTRANQTHRVWQLYNVILKLYELFALFHGHKLLLRRILRNSIGLRDRDLRLSVSAGRPRFGTSFNLGADVARGSTLVLWLDVSVSASPASGFLGTPAGISVLRAAARSLSTLHIRSPLPIDLLHLLYRLPVVVDDVALVGEICVKEATKDHYLVV